MIPFNRPSLAGDEYRRIGETLAALHISGDGRFGKQVEKLLEERMQVLRVLLTTSCTHALEMAALLLDIRPGDEVIVPSFTFVTTVNAFVLRGARPVFIDIHPDTLNFDERQLGRLITDRTRAIIPVHYAGVACAMDVIMAEAGSHGIPVVEDNAHGLLGSYRGRPLGSFGCLATQSFHETKNVTCGEGGALVINDPALVERAEIIREKGTDRSKFFRGEIDKYTWVDVGSSYVLSDILAAFLSAQVEHADAIQARRKALWDFYHTNLADWAAASGVQQPVVPEECDQAYHMYYLLLPTADSRDAFLDHLRRCGVSAVFHYLPLHQSEMGRKLGAAPAGCPVTESTSARLVRLPFFNGLREEEQALVVEAVRQFDPMYLRPQR